MCGIAEASLVMGIVSAGASYVDSQQQAKAEANRQRRMDQIAYENYQMNLASINDQKDETKQQAAQMNMDEAIEGAQAVGKSKVHFGEVGLGQFGMVGSSPDDLFGDIMLQSATARTRRTGDVANIYRTLDRQADASYLNYKAKNASFAPIFSQGFLTPIAKVVGAGTDYMQDGTRKYLKDPSGKFKSGYGGWQFP